MLKKVLVGTAYTAVDPQTVAVLPDRLIEIDGEGMITAVLAPNHAGYQDHLTRAEQRGILWRLPADQVILPGFVDLHVHAPQWPQAGRALDRPLEDWLNDYTFPLEARYRDRAFARRVYRDLVGTLLANGTTTVLFYGTIHREANLILAQECLNQGLRSAIGQVVMDNPDQTPAYYRDASSEAALESTRRFVEEVWDLGDRQPLAPIPVITPRFAPSCTDATLAGLGQLAAEFDLPIQTHVSESRWAHQYALDRFGIRDAEVLDQFGLLTDQTVLAHGTQLTEADQALLRKRGTALAHCPISNTYFGNSILPVKDLLDAGNEVGLGTDISGGYSPSLYDNVRQAVALSQVRSDGVAPDHPGVAGSRFDMATAFYLATRGGAAALNLPVGQVAPGSRADLQVIRDRSPWGPEDPLDRFERLLYQAHREEIVAVMVDGDEVLTK